MWSSQQRIIHVHIVVPTMDSWLLCHVCKLHIIINIIIRLSFHFNLPNIIIASQSLTLQVRVSLFRTLPSLNFSAFCQDLSTLLRGDFKKRAAITHMRRGFNRHSSVIVDCNVRRSSHKNQNHRLASCRKQQPVIPLTRGCKLNLWETNII